MTGEIDEIQEQIAQVLIVKKEYLIKMDTSEEESTSPNSSYFSTPSTTPSMSPSPSPSASPHHSMRVLSPRGFDQLDISSSAGHVPSLDLAYASTSHCQSQGSGVMFNQQQISPTSYMYGMKPQNIVSVDSPVTSPNSNMHRYQSYHTGMGYQAPTYQQQQMEHMQQMQNMQNMQQMQQMHNMQQMQNIQNMQQQYMQQIPTLQQQYMQPQYSAQTGYAQSFTPPMSPTNMRSPHQQPLSPTSNSPFQQSTFPGQQQTFQQAQSQTQLQRQASSEDQELEKLRQIKHVALALLQEIDVHLQSTSSQLSNCSDTSVIFHVPTIILMQQVLQTTNHYFTT